MPIPSPADFRDKTKKHSEVREMLAEMAENAASKSDATTKANTARIEAIAKAATLSSIGEWLTEDGKTTLSTLNTSIGADANKLKVIRTIEKIALLNASLSEKFYVQSVLRNQGANGSRIHVQSESQLGTNNRVASLIIADTVTTAGIQEYTVDGTGGIKLKILVNWDNFETNTNALNVNLPINNLKSLKEFQNESQLSSVPTQIATAKAEAISTAATAAATDATSKASAAETNAKNYTDQFFNQFLINQGDKWES